MGTEATTEEEHTPEYEFATNTSAHGFARVADNKYTLSRVIWVLLILTGFGVATWQITMRFIAYYKYDTTTKITMTFSKTLQFPAVTICNVNKYLKSQLDQTDIDFLDQATSMLNPYDYAYNPYSYEDYSYYDYGGSGDAAYGVPPAAPSGNTGSVNIDDLMANISLWYPGGFDFANFTKEKGWQLTDTNIHCEFKGVKCNISKSFTPVLTEYGLCYTFNAVPNSKPRVFQDQPGIGNGLKLIVNIEQSEYTNKMERGDPIEVGLLFQVHNQSEPPMMETKSLAVPPGFHAYAGVKRTDSAEMEPPYGICDRASPLKYYSVYTMSACVQECKLDHMMGNCTCKLLNYPGPGEVCSPKQIVECVKPILLEIKKNFTHMCPCKIPCQSVNYETYLSYAKLPSDETAPEVAMEYGVAQSDIEKNILVLDIFFQDLNYVISEQLPAIESSGLISDLGGQFGLFMGFSLLTLVEFIEFGFTRLILFICRPKKKKRTITPVLPKEQSNSKSAFHY